MAQGRWPETRAPRGMVCSPHVLASESGIAALRAGGNALAAAVAAAATIVVVVQQVFEQAAVTQATLLGGPTLPICAYRDRRPGDTEESDHERARTAADRIVELLAARTEET